MCQTKSKKQKEKAKLAAQNQARSYNIVTVCLPNRGFVGLMPLIASTIIVAIEILVALLNMITTSIATGEAPSAVLSYGTVQFHLTWGIVLSLGLAFIENSLQHLLLRGCCHFMTAITSLICVVFLIVSLYTWLWANDDAGMVLICKLLGSFQVLASPEQLRLVAYTQNIQKVLDALISWLFPIQCVLVFLDSLLAIFKRKNMEQVPIQVKPSNKGGIVRIDGSKIFKMPK